MDILAYHRQGISQRKIAEKLGISRNTVKRYINNPEKQGIRIRGKKREVLLAPYKLSIDAWLQEDIDYTAVWIYEKLRDMGFSGSYEIVKREVKSIKDKKRKIAYMRFETEPGYQGQVDFGEFQIEQANGSTKKVYLFSMILGYSRDIYGEFVQRCDQQTFLDCHIRAFEYFGGVPEQILYDRMRNVYIGKAVGKKAFNDTLMSFALHYGYKPVVAPAYAAWVKGKVERPYSFIREGFWRGYGYLCLESANRDLKEWLMIKRERVHGTTHEVVSLRFDRERPCLHSLPLNSFDTSSRAYRTVYKDCTVRYEGNSYVVPHRFVGEKIILRVKDKTMRIYRDEELLVVYQTPEEKGCLVQDKRFYDELRKDHEMNKRKYGRGRREKGRAKNITGLTCPLYNIEVETRPIKIYENALSEASL